MTNIATMVAAAKMTLQNLRPEDVAGELEAGDVLLVDVREHAETEKGVIPGAVLAPRGMIEFYADPSCPYHLWAFQPQQRVVLYCATGSRSALAAQSLRRLGYRDVAHLEGGFKAWADAGRHVSVPEPAAVARD